LADELIQSKKEQAGHVMLVDLVRNDLGKVCLPHAVKVKKNWELEKYPSCWPDIHTR
jgi:anthranilate/para-aminobenzoate synthase component I